MLIALLLVLAPWLAEAQTLSFSTDPGGRYVATISVQTHPCVVLPVPPTSVVVEAGHIAISAPAYPPINCGPPPPPWPIYVATAPIGRLSPGTYPVTWSQAGAFEVSGTLVVAPHPVPATSSWSLMLLVIALVVLATHCRQGLPDKTFPRA